MNHYERLGVNPDATPTEIKRAYRNKARQNHPDKGGSAEDFAPIGTAYEVLSDPGRRLLYDATGQDRQMPIEKEVESILMTLFNEALSQADDIDEIEIIATVREKIKIGTQRLNDGRKQFKARKKKLTAKRGKITSTGSVNLVHRIIDGELKNIEATLLQMDHQEKVQAAIIAEMDKYSEKVNPKRPPQQFVYLTNPDFGSFGFGGGRDFGGR